MARFIILVFMLASSMGFAQQSCEQPVTMKRYSACFPKKWFVEKYQETDGLGSCNLGDGKCTGTGGGFPLPRAVVVVIFPITQPEKKNMTANEIAIIERNMTPSGTIEQLDLGDAKKCFRYASLWTWFPIWHEVYGLQIHGTLFRVWVQYQDDKTLNKSHRTAVLDILKSVKLTEDSAAFKLEPVP